MVFDIVLISVNILKKTLLSDVILTALTLLLVFPSVTVKLLAEYPKLEAIFLSKSISIPSLGVPTSGVVSVPLVIVKLLTASLGSLTLINCLEESECFTYFIVTSVLVKDCKLASDIITPNNFIVAI